MLLVIRGAKAVFFSFSFYANNLPPPPQSPPLHSKTHESAVVCVCVSAVGSLPILPSQNAPPGNKQEPENDLDVSPTEPRTNPSPNLPPRGSVRTPVGMNGFPSLRITQPVCVRASPARPSLRPRTTDRQRRCHHPPPAGGNIPCQR